MKKLGKILVTGADGFIGSHLTETLVREGCDVRAMVLYNSFNSWGWLDDSPQDIKSSLEVCPGDIRDSYGVKKLMQDVDTVFHLAALISIPYSYHSPEAYIDTNVKGTLNILQAAKELRTKRVIHTSTSEVYGTAAFVPITESHPLQAQSPYAASKVAADQVALSFHKSFSLPVTVVRPFNTYGPRQSARAIIPTVITQIAHGGKEIKLGSLSPTRDFTYVQDTVDGFIAAALSEKVLGEVVNLGSNFEISIGDTVAMIAKLMEQEIQVTSEQDRIRPKASEVERLWSDNTKAKKLMSWSPKYASIEGFQKGLQKTIEWITPMEILMKYKASQYNI